MAPVTGPWIRDASRGVRSVTTRESGKVRGGFGRGARDARPRDARDADHRDARAGERRARVDTGEPFLTQLVTFARYSGLDLECRRAATCGTTRSRTSRSSSARGGRVLPATAARYGDRTIPMDDALVHAAIDLGGRPYYRGPLRRSCTPLMRSSRQRARDVPLSVLRGTDRHHVAMRRSRRSRSPCATRSWETGAVFSTKARSRSRSVACSPTPIVCPTCAGPRREGTGS